MNRAITIAVVLALAALTVVAAIGGFGQETTAAGDDVPRDDSGSRDLIGPHSPGPGALPGTLIVTRGEDCVVQLVDLGRMRFSKAGPRSGCDLIVAPDGETAAVVARGQATDEPAPMFDLVALDGRPEVVGQLGRMARDLVWSRDGTKLAFCDAANSSETVVVEAEDGARRTWADCWPAFGSEGALVTRTLVDLTQQLETTGIQQDGDEVVTLDQLLGAASSDPSGQVFTLGHTTGADGVIAVSLVVAEPGVDPIGSFQLWRAGTATEVTEIPLFLAERGIPGELTPVALRDQLALSPDGSEIAIVLEDGAGPLFLLDKRTSNVLGPLEQHDFDWSPDGRWFAVAGEAGIDVYGPLREAEPTYQIPLRTAALAWR